MHSAFALCITVDNDVEVIPIINKVDLPSCDIEATKKEIESVLGFDCTDIPCISAKTGEHVEDVLEAIAAYIKELF